MDVGEMDSCAKLFCLALFKIVKQMLNASPYSEVLPLLRPSNQTALKIYLPWTYVMFVLVSCHMTGPH